MLNIRKAEKPDFERITEIYRSAPSKKRDL